MNFMYQYEYMHDGDEEWTFDGILVRDGDPWTIEKVTAVLTAIWSDAPDAHIRNVHRVQKWHAASSDACPIVLDMQLF